MDKKRIAVLASGRGSNFQAILKKIQVGYIPATVEVCITNIHDAGVLEIAKENNIPARVISPRDFPDVVAFNDAILRELDHAKIDYIVLAGYLKLIGPQIVERFDNRILNIHPALLPAFGGKGMYGHHVHQAVYNRGVKVSGASVHLVNSEFDAGPLVMQKSIAIDQAKSPDDIAKAVLKIEHEIYPEAVKLLVENRIKLSGQRVDILGD